MTIKWTPERRIDRQWLYEWHDQCPELDTLADALDVAVAALRGVMYWSEGGSREEAAAYKALRQIGVDE